jgi:hypothetical protein
LPRKKSAWPDFVETFLEVACEVAAECLMLHKISLAGRNYPTHGKEYAPNSIFAKRSLPQKKNLLRYRQVYRWQLSAVVLAALVVSADITKFASLNGGR